MDYKHVYNRYTSGVLHTNASYTGSDATATTNFSTHIWCGYYSRMAFIYSRAAYISFSACSYNLQQETDRIFSGEGSFSACSGAATI